MKLSDIQSRREQNFSGGLQRGLLALVVTVVLLAVILFVVRQHRSATAPRHDGRADNTSGTGPKDKGHSEPGQKILQSKERDRQIYNKPRRQYYGITIDARYWLRNALRWLWRHRPDAQQILAFATILLVMISYWTLVDLGVTLERSERAWVGPIDVKLDGALQKDKEVKITVSVRNTGREPAIDVFQDINPFIVHKSEFSEAVSEKAMSEYVDWCLSQPSHRRQQVLYPSSGFGAGFDYTNIIDKALVDDALINGDDIILVRGCLVYSTFAKTRHSAFRFFYKEKVTDPAHFNICVGGSDAN